MSHLKLIQFVFFLLITISAQSQNNKGVKVGDQAPDFMLKNVNGKMVGLKSMNREKGVIVIFTCNHCPFSKAYEDRIIAIQEKFASRGFPVVAINPNDKEASPEDSYELMIERAKEKKFNFPYLYDETQAIAKAYGATRTPHVFVLKNNQNMFEVAYIGAFDDNSFEADKVEKKYLENAVENLIQNKNAEPEFTKSVGCTIKWKGSE
jgi:peroxiredoxin